MENSSIQFINCTPNDLKMGISDEVKRQIDEIKKEFQPKKPSEYLTRNEVAKLLKVDISTVHNYTKRKILQSWGIGRRIYYKRSQVEQAIIKIN